MPYDPRITGFLAQGLFADRPAAPNEATDTLSFYYANDTGQTFAYDWDATAWVQVYGSGDLVGPGSATDGDFAQFDGITGKLVKDGGLSRDTDVTLAANSDTKIPSQKAVKAYIDAKVAGLSWKQAVRAATVVAGTLATSFENGDAIDGVTLATGDRILIKNQAAPAENGIYVVAASGAPARASDADSGAELVNASCYISEGSTLADTQWTCTTNAPITPGSTSLTFAQFVSGGYTDENAQDAIGGIITGLSYNDATPSIAVIRVVQIQVTDPAGSAITIGDGKAYFRVNSQLNGYNLTAVAAALSTFSTSGNPTIQIANVTDAVDMLSTKLTIDANETDSSTAATPAAIDATKDDVATGDMLRIDIDVAGTGAKGLIVELTFSLP
jgi:hypothetical protein